MIEPENGKEQTSVSRLCIDPHVWRVREFEWDRAAATHLHVTRSSDARVSQEAHQQARRRALSKEKHRDPTGISDLDPATVFTCFVSRVTLSILRFSVDRAVSSDPACSD
jgi:hypothetical protein